MLLVAYTALHRFPMDGWLVAKVPPVSIDYSCGERSGRPPSISRGSCSVSCPEPWGYPCRTPPGLQFPSIDL